MGAAIGETKTNFLRTNWRFLEPGDNCFRWNHRFQIQVRRDCAFVEDFHTPLFQDSCRSACRWRHAQCPWLAPFSRACPEPRDLMETASFLPPGTSSTSYY